jgi:hypothetical protein
VKVYFVHLRIELPKRFARRRTRIGFRAAVLWQLVGASLLRLPAVRVMISEWLHQAGLTFAERITGLMLSIFIADDRIRNLPAMGNVRHHFPTTRMLAWVGAYNDPLYTACLRKSL